MKTTYILWALMALAAASCSSSTSPAPAKPGPDTVLMVNNAFNPITITVTKGTTVTWKNDDGIKHTATSDNALWNTGDVAGGASKPVTFDSIGTFPYNCIYHVSMGMKGTVIVK